MKAEKMSATRAATPLQIPIALIENEVFPSPRDCMFIRGQSRHSFSGPRTAFIICTALSTVVMVCWASSFRFQYGAGYVCADDSVACVANWRGYVMAEWYPLHHAGGRGHFELNFPCPDSLFNKMLARDRGFLGFAWRRYPLRDGSGATWYRVWIPHWCLSIVLWSLSFVAWSRLRWQHRREARARGRCIRCGYDLRASPERCPECGCGHGGIGRRGGNENGSNGEV